MPDGKSKHGEVRPSALTPIGRKRNRGRRRLKTVDPLPVAQRPAECPLCGAHLAKGGWCGRSCRWRPEDKMGLLPLSMGDPNADLVQEHNRRAAEHDAGLATVEQSNAEPERSNTKSNTEVPSPPDSNASAGDGDEAGKAFDKTAYQREYMRQRRAAKKEQSDGNES